MKKITLLGVLLQFVLHSCSNIKPPQNIVDAFAINYPSVTSVVWEQEEINLWEAKFKQDAIIYSAVFNLKGDLVEKEHTIKFKELPEVIKQAINI